MFHRVVPAILFSAVAGLAVWFLLCGYEKKKRVVIIKKKGIVITICYVLFLLNITVFFRQKGNGYMIDWIPFDTPGGSHLIFLYAISNIVVFIPLGLLCSYVFAQWSVKKILWTAGLLSGTIELMQLVLQCGDCQTEDVIMNVFGMVIGSWIFKTVKRLEIWKNV